MHLTATVTAFYVVMDKVKNQETNLKEIFATPLNDT